MLAGRGTGKTRTFAEWVREKVETGQAKRVAFVGATAADTRDTMVLGESGIIAVSRPDFMPKYEPSKRRVTWPNGAIATLYSADKPRQLRGPQHDLAWGDEIAAWTKPDTLDQLMFGLRLGANPQAGFSTTPARVPHLRKLLKQKHVTVTRGKTYENLHNLAPNFREQIIGKYEGTRLGRQELDGELLEDVEGALWQAEFIDDSRFTDFIGSDTGPDDGPSQAELDLLDSFTHITVAIDPTTKQRGDACGIVVVGKSRNGHLYVLEDATANMSPGGWADLAVRVYHAWEPKAPVVRLVAEANQGGEMITEVISQVPDHPLVRLVYASKGKHIRAEPCVELYEKKRVHHVGVFGALEEEMCSWVPGDPSPNRLDALVWAITDLAGPQKKGGFYHPGLDSDVEEIEVAPGQTLLTVRPRPVQEIRWVDGFLGLPGRSEEEEDAWSEDDESFSSLWR